MSDPLGRMGRSSVTQTNATQTNTTQTGGMETGGMETPLSATASRVAVNEQSTSGSYPSEPPPLRGSSLAQHQFEVRIVRDESGEHEVIERRGEPQADTPWRGEHPGHQGILLLPSESRADMRDRILSDHPRNTNPSGPAYWTPRDPSLQQNYDVILGKDQPPTWTKVDANGPRNPDAFQATRDVADLDRLRQAGAEQKDFIEVRRANPDLENPRNEPRPYSSREDFDKEARHLLVGRDASNNPIPKREELARGWGLFNNAKQAHLGGLDERDRTIVFGRTQDVNHTEAAQLGFTSEFSHGAVLMPERWNYFMNTCWVMGGVKGGADFVSGTRFEQVPRDLSTTRATEPQKSLRAQGNILPNTIGNKVEDDFRSDVSERIPNAVDPLHYTTTVSVAEIAILREAGYHVEPDAKFGAVLKPPQTGDQGTTASSRLTFMEAQSEIHSARVGMAMENLTGGTQHVPDFLDFIGQGTAMDSETKTKIEGFVKGITDPKGLDVDKPDNYLVRKVEVKVAHALDRLRHAGSEDVKVAAWREICGSAMLAVDNVIGEKAGPSTGLSDQQKDTMRLAAVGEMGRRSTQGLDQFGSTKVQDVRQDMQALRGRVLANDTSVQRYDQLSTALGQIKDHAKNYITGSGRDDASLPPQPSEKRFGKDEADGLFEAFRRDCAFQTGAGGTPDVTLKGFQAFADSYEYKFG